MKYFGDNPQLLAAAVDACPINITIADARVDDMPLMYVNPAFSDTTGYAPGDVLGQNCRFLQGPETDRTAVDSLRQAILKEQDVSVEFINYRKSGEPFLNHLKMAPVHDNHGDLLAYIGIQHDVTAEREREKREIHRQRMEALGHLSSGMAHQLNNLLQPIVSLAGLGLEAQNDPEAPRNLSIIQTCAREAASVVSDTLVFARQRDPETRAINFAVACEESLAFLTTMLPESIAVDLDVDPRARDLWIEIDPTHLSQALTNLLINASQAMHGKGRIAVAVVSDKRFPQIELTVTDEGPGIPLELRAKVLEPFFTTKQHNSGTGLGLPVVQNIVAANGGFMTIGDAGPNRPGCRVALKFPLGSNTHKPQNT
ncbi:MAG: PAS domain-containing protein [Pseudomonadota bacterium]